MSPSKFSLIHRPLLYMSFMYFISISILLKKSQAFEVSIIAGENTEASGASVSGTDQHFTTDLERETFGITDEHLLDLIGTFDGARPNEVYIGYPPWTEDFPEYERSPLKTVVTAQRAEILEVTTKPVIIAHQLFDNSDSSQKVTYTADMSSQKQTSIENNWSETNSVSVTQTISYEIGFLGTGVGGETGFSYSYEWGRGGSETNTITLGTSSGVEIELEPRSSSMAILSASQGVMKVRVYFQASLIDEVFYHYYEPYNDHYYWKANIANLGVFTQEITQDIDINYYTQSTIKVVDVNQYDEIIDSVLTQEDGEQISLESESTDILEILTPEIEAQISDLLQNVAGQVWP